MGFLNPLLLAGLAAVAIPIILHALSRRKARTIEFGAIRFLIRTQRNVQRKFRFQKLLLLLLRVLMLVALVLAFARPRFVQALLDSALHQPTSRAFILDDGFSMDTLEEAGTRFGRAKRMIADEMNAHEGRDNAALILPHAEDQQPILDYDPDNFARRLDEARISHQATDVATGLLRAAEVLERSELGRRETVVFTDLTRAGWEPADLGRVARPAQGEPPVLRIVDLSGEQAPENAWVRRVDVEQQLSGRRREAVFTALVAGRSAAGIEGLTVTLEIDGEEISRRTVDLPPGVVREPVTFNYLLPDEMAATERPAAIRLDGDPIPADNRYAFGFKPRRFIHVLLVDGDWRETAWASETFYAERALNPLAAGNDQILVETIPAENITRADLEKYQVTILANVREIERRFLQQLRERVRIGMGLLIAVGDQVEPTIYNRDFGDLLPHRLRGVKSWIEAEDEEGRPATLPQILAIEAGEHPLLASYDATNLSAARFERVMLFEEGIPAASVLMKLDNGLPVLSETSVGAGRALFWSSTLDRQWTDFPITTAFLPFLQQAVRYLAGEVRYLPQTAVVGEPLTLPPVAGNAALEIRRPDQSVDQLPDGGGTYESVDLPGVYALRTVDRASGQALATEYVYVNPPERESDVEPIPIEEIRQTLGETYTIEVERAAGEEPSGGAIRRDVDKERNVLAMLFGLLVFTVIGESFLVRRGGMG